MGQRRADRTDGGQVHGSSADRAARLVPEHGRRRDVAEQHLSQKGPKVSGSNSHSLGRVSAGAPKITGTHTTGSLNTHTTALLHLLISHAQHEHVRQRLMLGVLVVTGDRCAAVIWLKTQ